MSLDTVNSVGLVVFGLVLLVVCKAIQMVANLAADADESADGAWSSALHAHFRVEQLQDRVTQLELGMQDTKPKAERPARIKPGKADKAESVVAA